MKTIKSLIFSLFLLGILFQSCSTKVDLYADYKDITVIYGLLDYKKDTNFVKINKAFLGPGNAIQIAQNSDSCNYPYKLNARIIESRATSSTGTYTQTRVLELDTITIHNKETGTFYSPDQLVYYTTEKINANSNHHFYRYELEIDRGDTILRSNTNIVGGGSFNVVNGVLNFASNNPQGAIKWYPCPYASIYDVSVQFRFMDLYPSGDSVPRIMDWQLGTYPISEITLENGAYAISYNSPYFFQGVATELGNDTLKNIERLVFEPALTVKISAGGEELYNFIAINGPSSSIVQNVPEYSNISGGYGVFSSRTQIEKRVKFSAQTLSELQARENWHFRQVR